MIVDDNLTDIVADRIDAGIRFGDIVEKDMIAIRIGPDIRMSVVGAPSYFARHPDAEDTARPGRTSLHQLPARSLGRTLCMGLREQGAALRGSRRRTARLQQRRSVRESALAGHGLAYMYDDMVAADVKAGRLRRILEKWCPIVPRLLSLSSQPAADAARTDSAHCRATLQSIAARDRVGLAQTILLEPRCHPTGQDP